MIANVLEFNSGLLVYYLGFVAQALYIIGFLYLLQVYKKTERRTTLILAAFFLAMSLGGLASLFAVLWFPEYGVIKNIARSIAFMFLLIAALETVGQLKYWPGAIVVALIALFTDVYLSQTDIAGIFIVFGTVFIFIIPLLALYTWGYYRTKSGKPLAFVVGLVCMLFAGFTSRIDLNYFGLFSILAALSFHVGLLGGFDWLLQKIRSQ